MNTVLSAACAALLALAGACTTAIAQSGQVLQIPARGEIDLAGASYRQGLVREVHGDESAALSAFLEAGEAGHGLAQRRLGEIFDRGNSAVERDYQTSLKWFEKARAQGVAIREPFVRSPRLGGRLTGN